MMIEFVPDKRAETLAARGLDFARADEVFAGRHFTDEDRRGDYGDYSASRYITIGPLDGRLVVMVWTPRARHAASSAGGKPMNGNKHAMPPEWIDTEDAPELNDEFFERADLYAGDHLVRRGRPIAVSPKVPVTVRYDAEVVAAFKATGKGWQTRMNDALKEWLATHPT